MKYNFDLEMGAKISAQVVEQMVINLVEEQVGKKVANIEQSLNNGKFNGYTVTFTQDQVSKSTSVPFTPATYSRVK